VSGEIQGELANDIIIIITISFMTLNDLCRLKKSFFTAGIHTLIGELPIH
jgi:hypothetical protein